MSKAAQYGTLRVVWGREGNRLTAAFSGTIDESARLGEFAAAVESPIVLDLAGVSFVNSVGVRELIAMTRALSGRNITISVRRCPEPIVRQFNLIYSMLIGLRVDSFFAPYVCTQCGHESRVCIDVMASRDELRAKQLPARECPSCSRITFEFDELPESYLAFCDRLGGR